MKSKTSLFNHVYLVVRQIPKGKVSTYGTIAQLVGTPDSRKVGWALHANSDSHTPCHRVVNKEGKLALNFAFDGWQEQKRRLLYEGITFKSEMHVDLEKHCWNG